MFNEHVQSGRAGQRERTREVVITAAEALFRSGGFRGTTVRAIAAAAEVSVGTVMAVGDKDAILLACYDRAIAAIHADYAAGEISQAASLSAPEKVGAVVAPFLDLFAQDWELAGEYASVLTRGKHTTEVFGQLAVELIGMFDEIYRDAGLGDRAAGAARATYFAYLGLLMATAATGASMSDFRSQLEDVAGVLVAPINTIQ